MGFDFKIEPRSCLACAFGKRHAVVEVEVFAGLRNDELLARERFIRAIDE